MAWAHLLLQGIPVPPFDKLSLNPRLLFKDGLFYSTYFLAMFLCRVVVILHDGRV